MKVLRVADWHFSYNIFQGNTEQATWLMEDLSSVFLYVIAGFLIVSLKFLFQEKL